MDVNFIAWLHDNADELAAKCGLEKIASDISVKRVCDCGVKYIVASTSQSTYETEFHAKLAPYNHSWIELDAAKVPASLQQWIWQIFIDRKLADID